jgi:hypothetical protein
MCLRSQVRLRLRVRLRLTLTRRLRRRLSLRLRVEIKVSLRIKVISSNPYANPNPNPNPNPTLTGSAELSICASSNKLVYSWTLTNSSGITLPLQSSSINPKKYVISAYSFIAGSSYIG